MRRFATTAVLGVLIAAATGQLTWDLSGGLPLVISDSNYDYVYGPGTTPVEQINLATSTPTFLTYTPNSSTYVATNSAGDLVGFWGYDAYGNLSYGTPVSPAGYAGQYTDAASGLSNMRARFYQSQTGGFTTRDAAFAATDIAYSYANGDPVNAWDPYGLCIFCLSALIGVANDVVHVVSDANAFVTNLVVSPFTALYHVGVDIYQNGANNCYGWRGFFTTKNLEDVGGFTTLWTADAFTIFGAGSAISGATSEGLTAESGVSAAGQAHGGVYSLRDPETSQILRTGRSINLAQRASQHANDPVLGDLEFKVEYRTDNYAQQRGLEQILYDRSPGAQVENGGFNKIRAIRLSNPNLPLYMHSANEYLSGLGSG